jgi:hypothetical protein
MPRNSIVKDAGASDMLAKLLSILDLTHPMYAGSAGNHQSSGIEAMSCQGDTRPSYLPEVSSHRRTSAAMRECRSRSPVWGASACSMADPTPSNPRRLPRISRVKRSYRVGNCIHGQVSCQGRLSADVDMILVRLSER